MVAALGKGRDEFTLYIRASLAAQKGGPSSGRIRAAVTIMKRAERKLGHRSGEFSPLRLAESAELPGTQSEAYRVHIV